MIKFAFTLMFCLLLPLHPASAANHPTELTHAGEVIQQFQHDDEVAPERAISVHRKHEILFWMGGALLLLIVAAAAFGIAMGIFGKDVFVWHILSAGLATTLAIAHAVVAFVWFYPD